MKGSGHSELILQSLHCSKVHLDSSQCYLEEQVVIAVRQMALEQFTQSSYIYSSYILKYLNHANLREIILMIVDCHLFSYKRLIKLYCGLIIDRFDVCIQFFTLNLLSHELLDLKLDLYGIITVIGQQPSFNCCTVYCKSDRKSSFCI